MSHQESRRIPADHASIAGHFPGNPVVPGVVILDEVLDVLQHWQPDIQVTGFVSVKFLSVLMPGHEFRISLDDVQKSKLKFSCASDAGLIATGQISVTDVTMEDTKPA